MTEQKLNPELAAKFINIVTTHEATDIQARSHAWQTYLDANGFRDEPMLAVDKEILETVGVRRGTVTNSHLISFCVDARIDMIFRLLDKLDPQLLQNQTARKFIDGMFKDLQSR